MPEVNITNSFQFKDNVRVFLMTVNHRGGTRPIMVNLDAQSCGVQPLNANLDSSERCSNPFCDRWIDERQAGKEVLL